MTEAHPLHQNILDAAALAFRDVDFQLLSDIPQADEPDHIVCGSIRSGRGYDPEAACSVEVTEFRGLLLNGDGEAVNDHRVVANWDDGEEREMQLYTGEVLFEDNGPDSPMLSQEEGRRKILQGLLSIMNDEA